MLTNKKKKKNGKKKDMAFVQIVYFLKTDEYVLCIAFLYLCIILIWSDRKEKSVYMCMIFVHNVKWKLPINLLYPGVVLRWTTLHWLVELDSLLAF